MNSGVAYLCNLASAAPTVSSFTLNNPAGGSGDGFGGQAAISGSRIVIGAPLDDAGAPDAGSAYLYDLSSAAPTVPAAALNFPGPGPGDQFGSTVAVSGAKVVAGAPFEDAGATDSGSAYVYDLTSPAPGMPVLVLPNPSPAQGDQFGSSAAISGNLVVIGAFSDDTGATDAGSAYVYDIGSSTPGTPLLKVVNPSNEGGNRFGNAMGLSGSQMVVAAKLSDVAGVQDTGRAYVFDLKGAD